MKLIRILITIVLTLAVLIMIKTNTSFKTDFYKRVYDTNISFAKVNNWYQNKFGSPIPFSNYLNVKPVFNEKLKYSEDSIYKNGVKLIIDNNYLVPSLKNGIIIFIGEKEGYGNTVIVQQENGVDVWYSNLTTINVKQYDYISGGSLIGEANGELYLVFIKDGEVVNYKDNI